MKSNCGTTLYLYLINVTKLRFNRANYATLPVQNGAVRQ